MPPTPVKLATAGAFRLAIDDASVYWVGPGNPGDAWAPLHFKISKMPKAGGEPVTGPDQTGYVHFAVADEGALCYGFTGCGGGDCYGETLVCHGSTNWSGGGQFSIDGQDVFFTHAEASNPGGHTGAQLLKAQKGVSGSTVLAKGESISTGAVWLQAGLVYWATNRMNAAGDVVGSIVAVTRDGTPAGTVFERAGVSVGALKGDFNYLYFRSRESDVYRVVRTGGDPEVLWKATSPQPSPGALGVDTAIDVSAGVVYWNSATCLWRLDSAGAKCLDEAAGSMGSVRVDDSTIFYVKDGDIWALGK